MHDILRSGSPYIYIPDALTFRAIIPFMLMFEISGVLSLSIIIFPTKIPSIYPPRSLRIFMRIPRSVF